MQLVFPRPQACGRWAVGVGIALWLVTLGAPAPRGETGPPAAVAAGEPVLEELPDPDRRGNEAFELLLQHRFSVRDFTPEPLDRDQIGQLLWACCGETRHKGFMHRTVPSAGALYPLEVYLLTAEGVAHYRADEHVLEWLQTEDRRAQLADVALHQSCVADAPAVIVIAAEPRRTKRKYGERGDRYVVMEAGFAGQNLLLQAVALGLGGVPVGAFEDEGVAQVLGLPALQRPFLIVPVGHPAQED